MFTTNPNKDYLRSDFDKELIKNRFAQERRPLAYLGLPGPDLLDIVAWQEFLARFTAIERGEGEQHLMFLRSHVKDVEHRLHSLYGEFDEILNTGRDRYKKTPKWPYDVVNLDFFGGMVYKNLGRPKALKKLIANQSEYEQSFLLLITQDLRDGDSIGEKMAFLDKLEQLLIRDGRRKSDVQTLVNFYKQHSTPDAARQALYVNVLLRSFGEAAHFQVKCRPPVTYTGTGNTKMIHYATDFTFDSRSYQAVSQQSLVDVVNLGLRDVQSEQLVEQFAIPRIT